MVMSHKLTFILITSVYLLWQDIVVIFFPTCSPVREQLNTFDLLSLYPKTASGQLGLLGIINKFGACFEPIKLHSCSHLLCSHTKWTKNAEWTKTHTYTQELYSAHTHTHLHSNQNRGRVQTAKLSYTHNTAGSPRSIRNLECLFVHVFYLLFNTAEALIWQIFLKRIIALSD